MAHRDRRFHHLAFHRRPLRDIQSIGEIPPRRYHIIGKVVDKGGERGLAPPMRQLTRDAAVGGCTIAATRSTPDQKKCRAQTLPSLASGCARAEGGHAT